MKAMKKIVDVAMKEWPKLSVPARTYVKHQLNSLDVNAAVAPKTDAEKERV
jgi:hypothetical protein